MKRFTETNKWRDRWFYALSGKHKLLWLWLCDNCDNCGVVEPEWNMVKNDTGFEYSDEDLEAFGDRIEGLSKGKHTLVKFIAFQYGKLSAECKPHAAILANLNRHRLVFDNENQTLSKGIPKGIHTQQEKEKEKDKDKKRDQGEEVQEKGWKPDDLQRRINRWFNRRDSTPWSDKELKSYKTVKNASEEDLSALETRYLAGGAYLRQDVLTLLNNWPGEIDRARRAEISQPEWEPATGV